MPAHLPREERRIEPVAGTCTCPDCGGALRPLGEDSDEMLDVLPVQWRVIRTVRPKYSLPLLREDRPGAGTTADALKITNTPTQKAEVRLRHHAEIMQIIRDIVGRAIVLTNAYRNPTVRAVCRTATI